MFDGLVTTEGRFVAVMIEDCRMLYGSARHVQLASPVMPRKGFLSFTSVIVILVVLSVTGCSANNAPAGPRSGPSAGFVGGPSLTRIEPGKRTKAPIASGKALSGKGTISTADYPGKVIVVNVWGSWCAPCREEAPDLVKVSTESRDVAQFVGINIRDLDRAPAQAFVRAFKVRYPSIYDPRGEVLLKFANDLPPVGIPATLIIDTQGRSAVRIIGKVSKTTLTELIAEVAEGR